MLNHKYGTQDAGVYQAAPGFRMSTMKQCLRYGPCWLQTLKQMFLCLDADREDLSAVQALEHLLQSSSDVVLRSPSCYPIEHA